ncbi:MAG TPA: aminotransferase class V-fold PLP-dependent enzyme [Gaiellaceae bacterium]|jgi:selenocysteine lyase/cysteine desulfurase|nr:aminotransferase class V-fold PLP-dependent enzyme [Gaiellaceae bacterium]
MASLAPREHFPHLEEVVYLNAGSIGLMPTPVQEAATAFERDIWLRGTTGFDEAAETGCLEDARDAAARLLAADRDDVAIVKSATEAFGMFAWWVQPLEGTNVVTIDIEHPSTAYPWLRVARETGAEERLVRVWDDPASLSLDLLAEHVDEQTSVIVVSYVQYSTGFRFVLRELADLAHAHGALLAVDATQAAGMAPIDVAADDLDLLVAGGYKWLCGPFGAAVAWLRPELRERFDPPIVGWRSTVDPYTFDSRTMPLAPTARSMEYSTMGYGSAVALGRALEYVNELGVDRILAHDQALATRLADGLERLGAQILTPRDDAHRGGIVTARYPGRDGEAVAGQLNDAGVIVSPRFGATRYSLHFFNDESDVDRALERVERILA